MTQSEIFEDKKFQKTLTNIAQQNDLSLSRVQQDAKKYLGELYTSHQPMANVVMLQAAQYVLSRGYHKTIDINSQELKNLTKLMHKYSVAFVTTHKTYIDMFVLAIVLYQHGLPIPYTFAGINMSFLGLGQFARQTGGIFIRRSFKENLVYKATLRHFISALISQKSHFMWAIEGTRSRTGKLVWPKMGILKYIAEAEQHSKQDVKYVPVSIVYDLIPDVKVMTEEGRGKDKKPESLWWWTNYLIKISGNLGKISLRLGDALEVQDKQTALIPDVESDIAEAPKKNSLPRFAFELVHRINQITPVTTTSLICTVLLSKFSLKKRSIERDVVDLMGLIEGHKTDALVDRSKSISESVQTSLNLLLRDNLIQQRGTGLEAEYMIVPENHLAATYYANMSVHHLYRRAFIELALLKSEDAPIEERQLVFWSDIMKLRDLFKFEFFYSNKVKFTEEVEEDLSLIDESWKNIINGDQKHIQKNLRSQQVLVAPVLLYTYVEAYRVVAYALQNWDATKEFDDNNFIESCLILGEKLHWQGKIQRIEAVSKPFLRNGIRLAQNYGLVPSQENDSRSAIEDFLEKLDKIAKRIKTLQEIILDKTEQNESLVPLEREIVPGSKTTGVVQEVLESKKGKHIAAFFDLDRTLIRGFSAKEFFQNRLLSGKMTAQEVIAQFVGVMVYAAGNGNFAGLAAIGAKGIKGIKEEVFIEVGEEVFTKQLAEEIYPESRALVAAHLAQGHTVAIVSAATPYQINPVARDLGIEHVLCTRMEVENGKFTGRIIDPACWGIGKSKQASNFAMEHGIDLTESYFYTDSVEDMPLLEIVGKPRPVNPDKQLTTLSFQNNWPIHRFDNHSKPKVVNIIRTGLALGSLLPATFSGVLSGLYNFSWKDGINSATATIGDLGTALVGISLVVRGEENLWKHRPAVFIFNHQSAADLFIVAKLLRKDILGVGKKELQNTIYGMFLKMAGVVFVDRGNSDKAISSLNAVVKNIIEDGKSLAISPEGTRSYDYKLGRFKKGAFHIAMRAGVPIIPIVIRNAHDVLPRGNTIAKPSAVDIVVCDPVETTSWKEETLDQHIQEVRAIYLEELGQAESLKLLSKKNV